MERPGRPSTALVHAATLGRRPAVSVVGRVTGRQEDRCYADDRLIGWQSRSSWRRYLFAHITVVTDTSECGLRRPYSQRAT